jgi:hypothetical protein
MREIDPKLGSAATVEAEARQPAFFDAGIIRPDAVAVLDATTASLGPEAPHNCAAAGTAN